MLENSHAQLFYEKTYGSSLDDAEKKAKTLYGKLVVLSQYQEVCKVMGKGDFDCPASQRKLIRKRRGNPFLERALANTQSLEVAALELYEQKYGGIKKFLPHQKDLVYNQKLEKLRELVDVNCILETNGIFYPKSALTVTMYGFIGGAALGGLYLATGGAKDFSSLLPLSLGGCCGLISGGMSGFLNLGMHNHIKETLKDQTHYLDEKIKELF